MATITYPVCRTVNDAGTILTGCTVSIASVLQPDGTPVASHGAQVQVAGSLVSVTYDAATKGDAWITLSVSKSGETITNENASPAVFASADPSRITYLDASVSSRSTYAGGAVASVTAPVQISLSQTGLSPRALDAVADGSLTVGDCLVAAVCGAAGKETVSGTSYVVKTPSTGTVIRTFTLDSATLPTART